MNNPRIYIVLNKELNMSPGKAAAQAVQAAMMLSEKSKSYFLDDYERTVIVLEAENSDQIRNLYCYLDDTDIDHDYYIDEGSNEVMPYSITALAAFSGDNERLQKVLENFRLYRGVEVNRKQVTLDYLEVMGRGMFKPAFISRTYKWLKKQ